MIIGGGFHSICHLTKWPSADVDWFELCSVILTHRVPHNWCDWTGCPRNCCISHLKYLHWLNIVVFWTLKILHVLILFQLFPSIIEQLCCMIIIFIYRLVPFQCLNITQYNVFFSFLSNAAWYSDSSNGTNAANNYRHWFLFGQLNIETLYPNIQLVI